MFCGNFLDMGLANTLLLHFRRIANNKKYLMLLNYTADEIDMGVTGKSFLDGKEFYGTPGRYGVETAPLSLHVKLFK